MKALQLLSLLLSMAYVAIANVVIRGKMVNNPYKGYIYYNEPIDGFEDLYFRDKRVPFDKDSSFTIHAKIGTAGFFNIKLPGQTIKVFVNKSDTINFIASFRPDPVSGKYVFNDVSFEGRNAPAYREYVLSPVRSDFQKYLVNQLFTGSGKKLPGFYKNVDANLNVLLQPFGNLRRNKQIDPSLYNVLAADISSVYAAQVITLFNAMISFKLKDVAKNSVFSTYIDAAKVDKDFYTVENYDSLKLFLYQLIDPLNPLIYHSFLGLQYPSQYSRDINNGKLITQTAYKDDFKGLKDIEHYGYLSGKFLEGSLKSEIYWAASTEADHSVLVHKFRLFNKYFPASKFRPFLAERVGQAAGELALRPAVKQTLTFINDKAYGSLPELIKDNFKTEIIFVDMWATWCAPCIYDFSFKHSIQRFLQTNNIKTLYLSVDREEAREKWKKIAYGKQLAGSHYIASEAMIRDLKSNVYHGQDITVPRYLLVNSHGEILHENLPRPSDYNALINTIKQLIAK
ncbi:hypothetical protein EXU57_22170 [Segetibacter sp. 3557_3]|uniref:TlpA family protein disulfide reductase n=1 Tax=Segetibacter sp. 3557_3 TaxID=2547429 RepID=UPI0010587B64|nr:hypothetical protein [Segetibacter sp. 3557_3]TDH19985.1 hypothetical protein EXU57_22170 [Segetibacter sp. 3557_3]